nr:hypothetical protein [Tanacetum cinerariifolium]
MKNKRRAKRQWRAKRMRNGHGEKEGRGRVEPREELLRGRSLAPLQSLQGSKPFFNIGDKERGRDGRDQTGE